jgi:ACS family allantoate permease-like MFS transporter
MTLVSFSIGNIIGTEIFQPKDAPDYIPGKIAIMVLLTVQLFVSYLLRVINIRLNVKKQAQIAEEKAKRGWTDADIQRERDRHAFADLTDKELVHLLFLMKNMFLTNTFLKRNMYFVYTA